MTAITAALARIADDPAGALRSVWNDPGARFAIIAAILLGALNIAMNLADAGGTTGIIVDGQFVDTGVWVAMTVSLMLIARALAMHPVSGGLEDPANITLLVSIIATVIIQFGMGFGLGGGTKLHDCSSEYRGYIKSEEHASCGTSPPTAPLAGRD